MNISKSATLFLERADLIDTYRGPTARTVPMDLAIHQITLVPPLPIPALVSDGTPPPDRGSTEEPWPHGERIS